MRTLSCAVAAAAALAACGGTITTTDGGADGSATDASTSPDASATDAMPPPFDAGSFCSGSSPRLVINGAEVPVMSATGKGIVLNCCYSAELTLATAAYQALMNIVWRNPATGPGAATIDLANPPQGFAIEMDLGCDPATTSCANASPEERYTEGFSGTLQYGTGNGPMSVSYCLQVAESAAQPHPTIHSMMLYAPAVPSP